MFFLGLWKASPSMPSMSLAGFATMTIGRDTKVEARVGKSALAAKKTVLCFSLGRTSESAFQRY